jgi:hypothetical protein
VSIWLVVGKKRDTINKVKLLYMRRIVMKKIFLIFILLLVCPLVVIAAKNNINLQMLRSSINMPVGTTLMKTQIGVAFSSADCPINVCKRLKNVHYWQ